MILKDRGSWRHGYDVILSDEDVRNFTFTKLPDDKLRIMFENRKKFNKFVLMLFFGMFLFYMISYVGVFVFLNLDKRVSIGLGISAVTLLIFFLIVLHRLSKTTIGRLNLPHYIEHVKLIERLKPVEYTYTSNGVTNRGFMYPVVGVVESNGYKTTFYISEEEYKDESLKEFDFVFYLKKDGVYEKSPDSIIPKKGLVK